jgi:hypothetical protein
MITLDSDPTFYGEPLKAAEQILNSLPVDCDPVVLIESMKLVCQVVSKADDLEAKLFVEKVISVRFSLTKSQANSMVNSIRELQKKNHLELPPASKAPKPVALSMRFNGLVDVVEDHGRSVFLFQSGEQAIVSLAESVELDGWILQPPPLDLLPYLLPSAESVMAAFARYGPDSFKALDQKLYDDLKVYIQQLVVLPEPDDYDLFTAWIIHTYFMEYFTHTPIVFLLGQPETGKSQLGGGLINASFRGLHLESLSASHLIRLGSDHQASLFFDTMDFGKKLSRAQTHDLFLSRFERGAVIPRITSPGKGAFLDTTFYSAFGPTVVASNESSEQSAFDSRTLSLRMPPLRPPFPRQAATQEVALPFKERLLASRAWHLGKELPQYSNTYHGRLGDITDPIFQIIEMFKPGARNSVEQAINKLTNDALACRSESPDMRILRAIYAHTLHSEKDVLTVKAIWQHVNGVKGYCRLSRESIGRRLNALGFDMYRTGDNTSAIRFNRFWLSDLLARYGI